MIDIESVRHQFEQKYPRPARVNWSNRLQKYGSNDLTFTCVQVYLARWEAWLACRESLVVELPGLTGLDSSFVADGIQKIREDNRYNQAISDCRKAIEDQSLKVAP